MPIKSNPKVDEILSKIRKTDISDEEIKALAEEGLKFRNNIEKSWKKLPESKVVGHCKVCSGEIKDHWDWKQIGEPVFGPGNRITASMIGLWCEDCGIKYAHPPKDK